MNILVLSWRDPKHPMNGGAEQVMHEHMKGWVSEGHSVILFSSAYKGGKSVEIIDGIQIIRKGRQLLDVQVRAFFWYFLSKHQKFDLIVDQFHGIPFFTPLYSRLPKLAVVQEVAKDVWLKNHLPKPFDLIIGYIGYFSEPLVFLLYRNVAFMTGSESAKRDLISVGIKNKNITIVPHGVKLTIPKKLPRKETTKTIVFLGALAKDKGIEDALRTIALLSHKGEYQFWIVGKVGSEYQKELNLLVSALGLDGKIKFWGFVSEEQKFNLLARAHLLINPSIREGWGLVNIEANAVSTPVVAYRSPGLIDSVKQGVNGVFSLENTPNSLADEVEKVINNRKLLSRLQNGAQKWSNQFTWEDSKKKSLALLNKIV